MKRNINYNENLANQFNKKEIDSFVNIMHYFWKFLKFLIIISIILGITYFLISAFLFKDLYSPDLLTELKRKYNEDFVIISHIEKDDHINIYKISPKDNKDIIFNAYQRITSIQDDYRNSVIKYYLEKYEQQNYIYGIEKKDSTYSLPNYKDVKFLDFDFWINVSRYEDIKEATTQIYNIKNFISQYVKADTIFTLNGKIKIDNYKSPVSYTNEDTLENLIYEEKYYYINYLKENNLDISSIDNNEIENIWRPQELKIVVDDKMLTNTDTRPLLDNSIAIYNPKTKEYDLNLINILENTKYIKKITNEKGFLDGLIYKGKQYFINKNTSNSLSNDCNTKTLSETLNLTVKYDYNKKLLYIFF